MPVMERMTVVIGQMNNTVAMKPASGMTSSKDAESRRYREGEGDSESIITFSLVDENK